MICHLLLMLNTYILSQKKKVYKEILAKQSLYNILPKDSLDNGAGYQERWTKFKLTN